MNLPESRKYTGFASGSRVGEIAATFSCKVQERTGAKPVAFLNILFSFYKAFCTLPTSLVTGSELNHTKMEISGQRDTRVPWVGSSFLRRTLR